MIAAARSRDTRSSIPHWILAFLSMILVEGTGGMHDAQGPEFLVEPPNKLEFTNSNGGRADCSARGNPHPTVYWLGQDNSRIPSVPSVRHLFDNGTLHFPPFEPEAFRQDIHRSTYRCLASNAVGTIVSRDVLVRAVVNQRYEVEVQSPGGFPANNVLFRCAVPAFVKDYVTVTSWLQQPAFNIYPSTVSDGKYHMLPSGELLILNVTRADAQKTYRCRAHHRLTQEVSVSRNEGKIQLGDIRESVPPILNKKQIAISAKAEETIVVACVAYANPRPTYRWFLRKERREIPLENGDKFLVRDGTLVVYGLKKEDAGSYFCTAANREGSEVLELQLSVTSPLSVRLLQSSRTAHLGRPVQFECTVLGFPVSRIQWVKDGQPVRFGSRIRKTSEEKVEIVSVAKEDRGMYQCIAKNEGETGQDSAELRLGEIYPQLTYKFIEQTLQPGPSVSLKCSASGNPTPRIGWFLDGFPLIHSERLLIGQYVTLFGDVVSHVNISSVKPEDGGEYECVAENKAGKVSYSARLNVYGLPFVRSMTGISAVAGKDLLMKCPVAGYPIEEVVWEKDGVRLPSTLRQRAGNNTLFIANVQRDADQGTYSCSARNKQGHASKKTVQVKVIVPPKITPFTFARDLKLGDRISVQCVVVSGDLPLTFVWLKDGAPPSESEALAMRRYDPFTSALTIGAIAPTHSGNYTCRASNRAATTSHTAPLRVNVPPRISPFYFEEGVVTGMRTQVMCSASQGDRPFNISWSKDGYSVTDSDVHISDFAPFSSILTIDNVASGHSGNYTCTVRNGAGWASFAAELLVTVPPFWTIEPERERSVILGNSVRLDCQADGFPKPTVKWKQAFGNRAKSSDARPGPEEFRELARDEGNIMILENGSLSISKSRKENEGYYMCEAENGVGPGKSKFIHFVVNVAPRFQFKTKQETARKGEPVHLKCEAEGDPPMEIAWKLGGNQINPGYDPRYVIESGSLPGGTTSRLTILAADNQDRGEYTCHASNSFGKDSTSILLTVQEPPGEPKNLNVGERSGRSVLLSWSAPIPSGDTEVTNYIVQFKESRDVWHEHNMHKMVAGDQTLTLVSGLRPATSYDFRIFAENHLGTSSPSESVSTTTEPVAPEGAPQKVSAEPVTSTAVRITWHPPDKELWNGQLIGYNIGYRKFMSDGDGYNWTHVKASFGLPEDFRLSSLAKFTKYSIVIAAYNAKGEGPASEPVLVETSEDAPSEPPQELECMGLTPQTLQVTWKPPPITGVHGVVRGYKVRYESTDESIDSGTRETEVTDSTNVVLHGLRPYANYSLRVWAYTKAGDGVRTPAIFCLTEESVPDPPEAVKAVVSSENAVIVSWLPPKRPNGVLLKYTVYVRVIDREAEVKVVKGTLPPQQLHYEAVGLKTKEKYEAWVTASTKAGQGQSSSVIRLLPGSSVPAAIISFGRTVAMPWKSDIRLPCLHVGQPRPLLEWRLGNVKIQKRSRNIVLEESALVIENAVRSNEGNYSCHVRNNLGADQISFSVTIRVPPTSPLLLATSITSGSVHLQWKQGDNGGAIIRGFHLSYKKESDRDWNEIILESRATAHSVDGLDCGTSYQFRLTAFNSIGNGAASVLNSVVTKGSRPIPPPRGAFLTANSTSVLLRLKSWDEGGCPITHFSVSLRNGRQKEPLRIDPVNDFLLADLAPSTEYLIKVKAYNSAGVTSQDYTFSTETDRRDPGPPDSATAGDDLAAVSFYANTQIIILGAASLVLSLAAAAGMCFCFHKRLADARSRRSPSDPACVGKGTEEEREKYYTRVRKLGDAMYGDITLSERIPERPEDIYPYATFHLPERENAEENPRLQPYLYENQDSDRYGNVRRDRRNTRVKTKHQKSESEEYDSLGSDSDAENDRPDSAGNLCESHPSRFPRGESTMGRLAKVDPEYMQKSSGIRSRVHHHDNSFEEQQRLPPISGIYPKKKCQTKPRQACESNRKGFTFAS